MPFACSICEQESTRICAYCTKDACDNHICERCGCCSDCCECEVPLDEATAHPHTAAPVEPQQAPAPAPLPEPVAQEPPIVEVAQPEAPSPVPEELPPPVPEETPEV